VNNKQDFEVVIVGGGAAGLSAALVLGRARRRVAVIDAGEPRNAPAAHMQGFLSRDGMPPSEWLAAGRAEVTGYGVEINSDRVVDIEPGFTVTLGNGRSVTARRILLATGVSDELPAIEGIWERWGKDLLIAHIAMAGRCATNPSACSAASPVRCCTHCSCGSGPTM
jgi:thioredoxin reductase